MESYGLDKIFSICVTIMLLIIFACFSFNPVSLFAAPYSGDAFSFLQPDGSRVEIKVWGDEFYCRVESIDGYTLIRDDETGWLCYAKLSADGLEFVATGIVYKGENLLPPASVEFEKHLELPRDVILYKADEKRQELNMGIDSDIFIDEFSQTPASLSGPVLGITLLIDFPDVKSTISQTEIERYLNQNGYSGYDCNGSVRDYFYEVSNGLLDYTNHVTAFYTAIHDKAYYTDWQISQGTTRARELIHEALNHLEDVVGFDFSTLSTNTSKQILAINAFYAGEVDNAWAEGLWPHKSSLSPVFAADGVKSKYYQITAIRNNLSLRTFCHENGHMLFDWPDLYDYGKQSKGIGNYCLMCGGGSNDNPVPPCAYLRDLAGWETIIDITDMTCNLLTITSNSFTSYRYSHPTDPQEYFLIESRIKNGRNTYLPDEGLMIWHIDKAGSNNNEQMTCSRHYKVSLEQADGLFGLEEGTSNGEAGDLFHGGYRDTFGDSTIPNSAWWCDGLSGFEIGEISGVGNQMSFIVNPGICNQTCYRDKDGDGYGNPSDAVEAGSCPSGYVENNADCDDSDPTVNPSASEIICNGKDDDCVGGDSCPSKCFDSISLDETKNGSWTTDCESTHRSDRYAKYYTFSLQKANEVWIDLESGTDTYMYLLRGHGMDGVVIEEDDDGGEDNNSRIELSLSAGDYTIEATTYSSGKTGNFTLALEIDDIPNLTPYKPSGWDDKIVVSKIKGIRSDDSDILVNVPVYIDYSFINNGKADAIKGYKINLYIDDNLVKTDIIDGDYEPNVYWYRNDFEYTFSIIGSHTIKMLCDAENDLDESNESDNEYSRTIYVDGCKDKPNLTPYKASDWDDKIVVSTVKNTRTNYELCVGETVYIDYCYINNGDMTALGGFKNRVYIDNELIKSLTRSSDLLDGKTGQGSDIEYTFTATGAHTIKLVCDADNSVSESNETDNEYSRTIYVYGCDDKPNLTPYKPSEWDDRIVVSNRKDTYTGTNIIAGEPAYIDFAYANLGLSEAQGYKTKVYIDNKLIKTYTRSTDLEPNYYVHMDDLEYTFDSKGCYTIKVICDAEKDVDESDEGDNEYSKIICTGLDPNSGGVPNSAWPCRGHDSRHTGQSPYVGAQTNTMKWDFQTDDGIWSSPVIGIDNTIYIGNDDGKLYALNPEDGSEKWNYQTGDSIYSSPVINNDGTIYVGSCDENLYALNPNGTLKWSYQTGDSILSSPVIGADGTIYVGSYDEKVYALNPNGTLKWSYRTGDSIFSSPVIGADGTIYVGSDDEKVYALNPNGTLKWSYQMGDWVESSPAIGSDGIVYVGSYDGNVYAFYPRDGRVKWHLELEGGVYSSPATGLDGTIYIGCDYGNVYALNPADGRIKWQFEAEDGIYSSPAIGLDGTVYIGSDDGNVYAINSNGNLKWNYQTGDLIESSPAIGSDGTIYIGSTNGKIYAFGKNDPYDTDLDNDGYTVDDGDCDDNNPNINPGAFEQCDGFDNDCDKVIDEGCNLPMINVTPSSIDFGTITTGEYGEKTFTVKNVGGGTLSGNASTSSPFRIFSGGSYNLGAGQSKNVVVRFEPVDVQSYNEYVTFTGGGGTKHTVKGSAVAEDSGCPSGTVWKCCGFISGSIPNCAPGQILVGCGCTCGCRPESFYCSYEDSCTECCRTECYQCTFESGKDSCSCPLRCVDD